MGRNPNRRQVLSLLAGTIGTALLGKCASGKVVSGTAEPSPSATLTPESTSTAAPLTASPTLTPQALATTVNVAATQELTPTAYLPLVATDSESGPVPSTGKVIHVRANGATNWDFGNSYYGGYVNQAVVDQMVDQGVMQLTGTATVAAAWQALLPGYSAGKAIAVKVSHNNAWSCTESGLAIDALIHPVNSIVRGLKLAGVREQDVWVYEAIRRIPARFTAGCLYPGVRFYADCCLSPGWSSDDPNASVVFHPPSGMTLAPMRLPDVVINATYLINIPIIKTHPAGASLAFKNHLGTVQNPGALHSFIFPGGEDFSTAYSPYVDIFQNPHIAKTVLTVGDAIFGAWNGYTYKPERWATFGNGAPKSLFFATDPVALDCVMCDFLAAETSINPQTDAYLQVAAAAGLGTYERGDPWGSGYSKIDYQKLTL